MTMLLDAAPLGGGIGVFAAVAFFLVLMAVAYIAFRLLRKTFKMAIRLVIVAIILAIAAAGSVSLWWLGTSKSPRPERSRPVQLK